MEYMNKIFYNLGSNKDRKLKMDSRLSYDSTIKTNLTIKPINQSKTFSLYYIPTIETMNLICSISKIDMEIQYLYSKLPDIAKHNFLIDIISSELQSTNEIEGVSSSKEELVQTTKKTFKKNDNKN